MIRYLLRTGFLAVLLFAAPPSSAAPTQPSPGAALRDLRVLDGRVATIGHRLAVANRSFCRQSQWLPGFAIHHLSQYGPAARPAARRLGLGDRPAILAIAGGGPAERAGLHVDDVLVAADDATLTMVPSTGSGSFVQVERLLDVVDRAFLDGVAVLDILRQGSARRIVLHAEEGCPSRFQLIPSRRLNALANGRYVQVTSAIADYVAGEDELAVVLAHEFAHNVLRHRARLDQAGVRRGLLGSFGRNAQQIRATEIEADRLSIYLLDRAGYDPAAAIRFWLRFGPRGLNFLDFLGSPTHPDWRQRIRLLEAEIGQVRRARAEGRMPAPTFLDPATLSSPAAAALRSTGTSAPRLPTRSP